MTDADPRWYEDFFDEDWLAVALSAAPEQTLAEVDFVVAQLALEPPARILDVACGHGRHALELARRGFRATGVDLSESPLAYAREHADGLDLELVQADMRELPWEGEFDGALNLYSSFGYYPTQEEDEAALAAIARSLRPGGRLVLDGVNPLSLAARFRPQAWEELPDGRLLLQEISFEVRTGRNAQTWTIVRPDGTRVRRSYSMRVYAAPELESMLGRAGLDVVEMHGGFDGTELGRDTWRLIATAERRA